MAGDVEFCIHIASLGVAHPLTVDPHVGCRVDAIEMEQDALPTPLLGQCEGAAIGAHAVVESALHIDVGRCVLEGIVDVDIERLAVALHLEASGHGDVVPRGGIYGVAIEVLLGHGVLGVKCVPFDFPRAVETHPALAACGVEPCLGVALVGSQGRCALVGHVGGMSWFLVLLVDGLVLPVETLGQFVVAHGIEAEPCVLAIPCIGYVGAP